MGAKEAVFMIGNGRAGTKLLSWLLMQGDNVTAHGEIGNGPPPLFYKDAYLGNLTRTQIVQTWGRIRQNRFVQSKDIYLEKNNMVNPILDLIREMIPQAKFIWLRRDLDELIDSAKVRGIYKKNDVSAWGKGRLIPRVEDMAPHVWDALPRLEKIRWVMEENDRMCDEFTNKLPPDQKRIAWYDIFTTEPDYIAMLYDWIGIEPYKPELIETLMKVQLGSTSKDKVPEGRLAKVPDGMPYKEFNI